MIVIVNRQRASARLGLRRTALLGSLTLSMQSRCKTFVVVIVLVLATASVIISCTSQPAEPPVTVRIGYLNITASLPLFIAEAKGFFAAEGIRCESTRFETSNQLVDGALAGNIDAFPESSAVPVLAAELQSPGRLKVFSVSSITKEAPFDALLVKEDSPIASLSDLAGKKIGVFPGTTATSLLKKYLSDRDIDVSHITFVPLPPETQLRALLDGTVDVVHAYEPTTAIAMNRGGFRKLFGSIYAEMLEPNPQGVAVVSTKFLQEHPETARKVIRAMERAMVFMRQNEAEARQIMAKRLQLDKSVAKGTVFLYMVPHKEINVGIFQRYADMLSDLGELTGRVDVDGLVYRQ